MVPVVEGQVLSVIVKLGVAGVVQVPGLDAIVCTSLSTVASIPHTQRT